MTRSMPPAWYAIISTGLAIIDGSRRPQLRTDPQPALRQVVKPDQIDIFSTAVFRHLEQSVQVGEARLADQLVRDRLKIDGLDRIDFNFAFFHRITSAHFHVGMHPDSNAARDVSPAHSLAQLLGEHHEEILYRVRRRPGVLWRTHSC